MIRKAILSKAKLCKYPLMLNRLPNFAQNRLFSDSHDDFLPKKKDVPEGLEDVLKLIERQVKENPIMLYMKGTPSRPQCGFSMTAVRILNAVINFNLQFFMYISFQILYSIISRLGLSFRLLMYLNFLLSEKV